MYVYMFECANISMVASLNLYKPKQVKDGNGTPETIGFPPFKMMIFIF